MNVLAEPESTVVPLKTTVLPLLVKVPLPEKFPEILIVPFKGAAIELPVLIATAAKLMAVPLLVIAVVPPKVVKPTATERALEVLISRFPFICNPPAATVTAPLTTRLVNVGGIAPDNACDAFGKTVTLLNVNVEPAWPKFEAVPPLEKSRPTVIF